MKSVEDLKRSLMRQKTMTVRFSLPFEEAQVYSMLETAVAAEVELRHHTFVPNPELSQQLTQLAQFLTSPDGKFGVILCGGCGNGKTTIMSAFQNLLNYLAIPIPGSSPSDTYGIVIVDAKYINWLCKTDYKEFLNLCSKNMVGIDDLGIEPREIQDFGNVSTPVIDFLTKRYERQLFTFITSNLTPKEFREKYGNRIADRLNEMMEKIVFTNGTYRI